MKRLIGLLSFAAVAVSAHAHFLWAVLDSEQEGVRAGLLEQPTESPLPLGDRAPKVQVITRTKKAVITREENNWIAAATNEKVVGVKLDYGVLDRTEAGRGVYWLNYYAKAASTLEESQIKLGLPVEVTASEGESGTVVITVLHDGKPAMGAEVALATTDDEDESAPVLKTDAKGQVRLAKPDGKLAVRCLVIDKTKGRHDGQSYEHIREYCTLTIGDYAQQPLTAIIQEAFGDRHEVVGKTLFIQTLMHGELTRQHVVDHLQQRAFIHEELDRILSKAQIPTYGAQQKEVLTLLKKDMQTAKIAWPKESEAWKLTADFLNELRESAKTGPYFALGVFHVYYGGITHGGRMIGAQINEAVSIDLTYYRLSEGYRPYARKVNEITNTTDQQEMVRGGLAAYKYIMASNDDESFKPKADR